jgi:hypothetical protein
MPGTKVRFEGPVADTITVLGGGDTRIRDEGGNP